MRRRVNRKGAHPHESSINGLEITHSVIPIAVMFLLLLLKLPSVCNADHTKAVATYDPNSRVAMGRQNCNGDTCCSPPYEIHPVKLWNFAPSAYSCCIPKVMPSKKDCCPHPLIPSKEPNVDPSFGPFCCDPNTGYCCSKIEIILENNGNLEYIYSVPTGEKCCPRHEGIFDVEELCCPRPLQELGLSADEMVPPDKDPNAWKKWPLCCSHRELCYEFYTPWHYDAVPSPRICSPRGFCCPSPYGPIIKILRGADKKVIYKDGFPQYMAEFDNQCFSPAMKNCTLPLVPWATECIEQPFATEVSLRDTPLYDIIPYEYSNADPSTTAASSTVQCLKNEVFRRTYGNPFLNPASGSVAINWFVTTPSVQRSKLINETFVLEQIWTWPGVIIPFIFPITIATVSVAFILPTLLLGAIGWAVVFNFRFLWHKKVRMAIRRILVCIEKRRRIIQDNYIPPEDQRKFHTHDRYQLPKALQDSDRSEDDEPEDLKREHADVVESNWTAEEIDALGFDPDNIPVDWIYGDLLGNPSELRKEVRIYNSTAKASGRPILCEDDGRMKQLDFEEWLHFLSKGETGGNNDSIAQGAKLNRKRSIHRYKIRKKIYSKRTKVRIEVKPSRRVHEKPSKGTVAHTKRSRVRKSKRKKKSKHRSKIS